MSPFPIFPVRSFGEQFPDNPASEEGEKENSFCPVSRVKGLVLERIGLSASRSALFPSASAPHVILELLAGQGLGPLLSAPKRPAAQTKSRKRLGAKEVPIGLRGWRSYPFFEERFLVNPFN